jgi:hypothetical protein
MTKETLIAYIPQIIDLLAKTVGTVLAALIARWLNRPLPTLPPYRQRTSRAAPPGSRTTARARKPRARRLGARVPRRPLDGSPSDPCAGIRGEKTLPV